MKKGQKLVTILVLIMIYVVLLPTCILPFFSRYYTYIINPIFWTALAILTYYFYKKVNTYDYVLTNVVKKMSLQDRLIIEMRKQNVSYKEISKDKDSKLKIDELQSDSILF